jgi:hypothetical protein
MIIETICERGVVRLPAELKFQHDTFKVKVEVPDREVSSRAQPHTEQRNPNDRLSQTRSSLRARSAPSIREEIDEILGPWKHQIQSGPPLAADDYDRLRHEALKEKYLDRK